MLQNIRYALSALSLRRVARLAPERVAAIQQRRLRRLVGVAVERSPFYRRKYSGINVEQLDLQQLPPTDKGELMANFDDAVTDPTVRRAELERFVDDPGQNVGRYFQARFAVSHTSGSHGQPMLMVQERWLVELFFAMQMSRGNTGRVSVVEGIRRWWSPARLAIVTLKRGFYPSASAFEYMPKAANAYLRILRLSQTEPELLNRLHEFRPQILTGYASVLETLAQHARAGRLCLAPELRQVVNNSEMLTDRARRRIEEAFGMRVLDNYATGECPFLSNGCPTNLGAHVNADWAILEVVDEHYRPVPPGTPGKKVLITNLANTVQPFIRYEVGDILTMAAEPCGCGSRLPRIERIDGRASDSFWIKDGTTYRQVPSSVFKQAFDYLREVREWQAVQYERNAVRVRLELLPGMKLDMAKAWKVLLRQLELYGFRDLMHVELETVPSLAPDPRTGKFRRTLSLVGAPSDLPKQTRQPAAAAAPPERDLTAPAPLSRS